MKYTVKWVEEKLGVSRKALRNYEAKGLMSASESRNPVNNYREYDEEDIKKIWNIKILQGIGYSVSEIRKLMDDPSTDFYSSISKKVEELEDKRDEVLKYIEIAKSIKLTGRIPTVTKVGSMCYDDFLNCVRENWNFYSDPKEQPYLDMLGKVINPDQHEWNDDEINMLERITEQCSDLERIQGACTINAYYKILSEMSHLDYRSETVQTVVRLLYRDFSEQEKDAEIGINPRIFAKYQAYLFLDDGDISKMNEMNYGKTGCQFIMEAIAYFGGFENLDELY